MSWTSASFRPCLSRMSCTAASGAEPVSVSAMTLPLRSSTRAMPFAAYSPNTGPLVSLPKNVTSMPDRTALTSAGVVLNCSSPDTSAAVTTLESMFRTSAWMPYLPKMFCSAATQTEVKAAAGAVYAMLNLYVGAEVPGFAAAAVDTAAPGAELPLAGATDAGAEAGEEEASESGDAVLPPPQAGSSPPRHMTP